MQTKLTLDEAWEKSLKMWKWIAEWWEEGDDVDDLKIWWVEHNGYIEDELSCNCFFCAISLDSRGFMKCRKCPANKVERLFHCSTHSYSWDYKPVAFYNKLVELNEIRLNNN